MSTWAIVVAGGSGTRFGEQRKQFQKLGDSTVFQMSVDLAEAAADGVVMVVPSNVAIAVSDESADVMKAVTGGATRSQSVRNGLAVVPDDAEIIVIHDAARPMATPELFSSVIAAVKSGADAAIPGLPVADTIKRISETCEVTETVERSELVAVQTPQAFRATVLRRAHAGEPEASDDAGLVEAIGGRVVVVAGESRNFKITWPDDLVMAKALIAQGSYT